MLKGCELNKRLGVKLEVLGFLPANYICSKDKTGNEGMP